MATAAATQSAAEKIATPRFALTERELKEYSLSRAILTSAENLDGIERSCFELEISQTIEKSKRSGTHGGIFIPWNIGAGTFAHKVPRIEKRAGLDSATATKGGELKFTKPGDFLEFLYNKTRVKELGAQTVTGLRENVAYPKQTGKASGTWVAENPGSEADVNLKVQATTHRPALEEYRTALAAAFELHFKHVHMRDDASQTAARIVREATENR